MMRALIVGSVERGRGLHRLQHDDQQQRVAGTGRDATRSSLISTTRLALPTPCRNRCTSSSGDVGSSASIGCVVESVSARNSRAATIGSTVMRVAVGVEDAHERVAVGHRAARHLVEARADARHEAPDVDDALLHDHDRGGERVLERRDRRDRRERGLERRGVERGLDDRDDDLVLVGEDPEDRALGDPGGLGDLPARDPVAVLEQQRQRGRDDRRPPLVGRQRRGPPRLGRCPGFRHDPHPSAE